MDLRRAIQSPQRDLLTLLWDYHLPEGLWMPAREFHHQMRGVTAARKALEPLGGAIIWRSEEPDDRYHLTVLGALLTQRGPELEGLLLQWLLYLKDHFWKDPRFSQVRLEEAQKWLELTGDQDAHLGRLIALYPGILWGGSGSGQSPWSFGPPHNIDELAEKSTTELVDYLLDQIMTNYLLFGNELPITGRERSGRLMKSRFTVLSGTDARSPNPPSENSPLPDTAPSIDFACLVDSDLRGVIEKDYWEASQAFEHSLYKTSAVQLGSVAEGLLLDLLQRPSVVGLATYEKTASEILPKMKVGGGVNWDVTGLDQLTRMAEALGLIHTTRPSAQGNAGFSKYCAPAA